MTRLFCVICVSMLLSGHTWAREFTPVGSEVLLKSTSTWDGAELPPYADGKPEITIQKFTIPPGVQLPMHKHTVINAGVVLQGRLTVETEHGKTLHLQTGDSINEVVETWHAGRNNGDVPVEIIVFYAGVEGEPVTVRK